MATLKCVREGRFGYHVGDLVEVPGKPDAVSPEFVILTDEEVAALKKAGKPEAKSDAVTK